MSFSTADKEGFRRHIRELKSSYNTDALLLKSKAIISKLESLPLFINARTILLYHSLPDEVNTHDLLIRHSTSKTLLLPTVNGDHLDIHRYDNGINMIVGSYGIQESCGDIFTDYDSIDLCIVPGMAFDKKFHRLGRGKGYYDRLLPLLSCKKIGLCFDFQYFDTIPVDSHDISMDIVLHDISINDEK